LEYRKTEKRRRKGRTSETRAQRTTQAEEELTRHEKRSEVRKVT